MSKAIITEQHLHDIADAIIAKGGATAPMTPSQMPAAIQSIPSGGQIDPQHYVRPSDWPDISQILEANRRPSQWPYAYAVLIYGDVKGVAAAGNANFYYPANSQSCRHFLTSWGVDDDATTRLLIPTEDLGNYAWMVIYSETDTITDFPWMSGVGQTNTRLLWLYAPNIVFSAFTVLNGNFTTREVTAKKLVGFRKIAAISTVCDVARLDVGSVEFSVNDSRENGRAFPGSPDGGVYPPILIDTSGNQDLHDLFSGCNRVNVISELDTSTATTVASMFYNCTSLQRVPDVLDLSSCTTCQNMFYNCPLLQRVPDVLDLSSCKTCSGMFYNCTSLQRVPDVLDLSSCTTCQNMFNLCSALQRVPDVLDLSSCTNCSNMFNSCTSLQRVPDVLDLSSCTNCSNMFQNCYALQNVPTHITVNVSISFNVLAALSYTNMFDYSSIAEFDEDLNIVGGMVHNINVCPNSGQTITFHADVKKVFGEDKWTAIKAALTAKNWGLSPA